MNIWAVLKSISKEFHKKYICPFMLHVMSQEVHETKEGNTFLHFFIK